jgi:hypothetical protein
MLTLLETDTVAAFPHTCLTPSLPHPLHLPLLASLGMRHDELTPQPAGPTHGLCLVTCYSAAGTPQLPHAGALDGILPTRDLP